MDNPKYIQVMRQVASDFDGNLYLLQVPAKG